MSHPGVPPEQDRLFNNYPPALRVEAALLSTTPPLILTADTASLIYAPSWFRRSDTSKLGKSALWC
ncbi:hypothetical protein PG990_002922 [Apiospora arundinis]|uniref:Uncharacterized protein n=1 Tax=Apiospora arundinis TaxID=335852 RepID=A0ABR2IHE2_9PEZI